MIRVNPLFLAGGAAMLIVGFAFIAYLSQTMPVGRPGMTEAEIAELLLDERQNSDMVMLASIIIGIGFLFLLISFGTARGEGRTRTRDLKKPPSSPPPQA